MLPALQTVVHIAIDAEKSGNRGLPHDNIMAIGVVVTSADGETMCTKKRFVYEPPSGNKTWTEADMEPRTYRDFWLKAGANALLIINAECQPLLPAVRETCTWFDDLDAWLWKNKYTAVMVSDQHDTDFTAVSSFLTHYNPGWRGNNQHMFRYDFPDGQPLGFETGARRKWVDPGVLRKALISHVALARFDAFMRRKHPACSMTHMPDDDAEFVNYLYIELNKYIGWLHGATIDKDSVLVEAFKEYDEMHGATFAKNSALAEEFIRGFREFTTPGRTSREPPPPPAPYRSPVNHTDEHGLCLK